MSLPFANIPFQQERAGLTRSRLGREQKVAKMWSYFVAIFMGIADSRQESLISTYSYDSSSPFKINTNKTGEGFLNILGVM